MLQQKWRRWIPDQGCQFRFFEARIWNTFGFFENQKDRQNLAFFNRKGLALAKHCLSCVFITNLFWPVYDHAGYREYCKDFTVALKIIDVIYKKQTWDSVITAKENASKDENCIIIILMFLTSFIIYFVFDYACFMWMCLKTGICLFLAFLGRGLTFFG